jgi:hypothetical protein
MKTVVSSKGKFASFLQMRNSVLSQNKNEPKKQDPALKRASIILSKAHNKHIHESEDDNLQYLVNPHNVHVEDHVN